MRGPPVNANCLLFDDVLSFTEASASACHSFQSWAFFKVLTLVIRLTLEAFEKMYEHNELVLC